MPISLLLRLIPAIIAVALLVASFYAGFKYSSALEEAEKARLVIERQEAVNAEIKRLHEVSLDYEKKIQEARDKAKVVYKTLEREIEKPVYKECVIPATGTANLNDSAKTFNEKRASEKLNDSAAKLNSIRNSKTQND